jgi:hypothetical protein
MKEGPSCTWGGAQFEGEADHVKGEASPAARERRQRARGAAQRPRESEQGRGGRCPAPGEARLPMDELRTPPVKLGHHALSDAVSAAELGRCGVGPRLQVVRHDLGRVRLGSYGASVPLPWVRRPSWLLSRGWCLGVQTSDLTLALRSLGPETQASRVTLASNHAESGRFREGPN